MKLRYIITVVDNYGDIELIVNCPSCNRSTLLPDQDSTFCSHCGNEIEERAIDAWDEYYSKFPPATFSKETGKSIDQSKCSKTK